jgi:hypothetical protein
MKPNTSAVDPLLRGPQSTTPHAVYQRIHRLHNPDAYAASDKANKARKRIRIGEAKQAKTMQRAQVMVKAAARFGAESYLATRVRFHLSKGRDASDIAIRENILVSVACELVKLVKGAA